MTAGRRGILAVYLGLCLLLIAAMGGAIWYLKQARQAGAVSLLLKLKADYQMESAVTMVMQKIRFQPTPGAATATASVPDALDLKSQEIAPGLVLSLLHNRLASDQVRFEARVEGNGFTRRLAAQATREILPDPGPASSVPEIVAAGEPRWYLEFLPDDGVGGGR